MAASFGARLLGEIHEEGLDELLHDLRVLLLDGGIQKQPSLGLQELDDLFNVFAAPAPRPADSIEGTAPVRQSFGSRFLNEDDRDMLFDELDGEEVPSRTAVSDGSPSGLATKLSSAQRKHRGPIVEISSTSSAAGKTQLLYYLATKTILPAKHRDVDLQGKGSAAVYIDTDGRFDAGRLRSVMRGYVRQQMIKSTFSNTRPAPEEMKKDMEDVIHSSLQHVHVFRPHSSSSLLATLKSLDGYLFDSTRHYSAARPVDMIIVDSITAFLWQDKLRDEVARVEEIGRPASEIERNKAERRSFHLSVLYGDILAELKRAQRRFGCSVIFTAVGNTPRRSETSTVASSGHWSGYVPRLTLPSVRSPLPAPWGTLPQLRLVVQRDSVRRFPPEMTPQEAEGEAAMRQSVVARGRFTACVNGWGQENWPQRVVDVLRASNGGIFAFYVRADGVSLQPSQEED